jgi:uncharacterized membrane protein (UPF0127 family)
MKRLLISAVSLITLVLIQSGCAPSDTIQVAFPNGRSVTCEIADAIKTIREGLQFHESLARDRGMLFIMPEERLQPSFYMPKRMRFNLDMIFLDKEKTVLLIERNLPPCDKEVSSDCPNYGPSGKPWKYVVEVAAGVSDEIGLQVGDIIKFELP